MAEYTIFSFRNGEPSARRQLYRKLYGYTSKGVPYPGLLSKCNGLKLGAGAIIVRIECKTPMEEMLNQLKVEFFALAVQGDELLLNSNANSCERVAGSK